MLQVIYGANQFAIDEALAALVARSQVEPEYYDGEELAASALAELAAAPTLFASERLIIIRRASHNPELWQAIGTLAATMPGTQAATASTNDTNHIVLVEGALDKRTKTYKALKAHALMQEFAPLSDRQTSAASTWLQDWAQQQGIQLDAAAASELVRRIGVDQLRLSQELRRLAPLGTITRQLVQQYTPANPQANVFRLLHLAVHGETISVLRQLAAVRQLADPYQTFGLLAAQVFQLAALTVSDAPPATVARDIAASEYAVRQLAQLQVDRPRLTRIVAIMAQADQQLKTTPADPWLVLQAVLVKIATS